MLRGQVFAAAGPAPPSPPIEYWLRPILRRSVTARRLRQPPAIDGVLGKEEFGSTCQEQRLLETHGRKDPLYETRFVTGYDDRALYVAVTAAEKVAAHDPARWRRCATIRRSRKKTTSSWRSIWRETASRPGSSPSTWTACSTTPSAATCSGMRAGPPRSAWKTSNMSSSSPFRTPLWALRSPNAGEKWALNVLRGRGPRDPKWELFSQWVMTYADFNSSTHLGTLHFE